jgi:hypothetical protein
VTYPLTPRADRLRILRARRDQLDALIRRLEDAERGDTPLEDARQCGTENGYKRHGYYGEAACDRCKRAHSVYERAKYARRRMRAAS